MFKSLSVETAERMQSDQITDNRSVERKKKQKDSDSEMEGGDSHQSRSQDTNSSLEESNDSIKEERKKKRKRKREFHLESVHFVDESGRTRKGKGNFRYSDSSQSGRRVYSARNGKDDYGGHEREQRGRWTRKEYDDYQRREREDEELDKDSRDGRDSNVIEVLYGMHLEALMVDPDAQKVSSLVTAFSPDDLERQEREEWKGRFSEHDEDSMSESP